MQFAIPFHRKLITCLLCLVFVTPQLFHAQQKRALTFSDVMKFKAIESPVISEDGGWVAYGAQPDRGDGEVKVQSVQSGTSYALERGTAPVFSKDARWVAAAVRPKATDLEEKKDEKDKPRPGLVLLNLITGDTTARTRVDRFAFSENAAWFAYLYFKSDEPAVKDTSIAAKSKKDGKKNVGGDLVLHRLETGREARIPFVLTFAFDSTSRFLAYTVADTSGKLNGLYYRDLRNIDSTQKPILANMNGVYTNLAWNNRTGQLAFVAATVDDKEKPGPGSVWIWESGDARPSEITPSTKAPAGWMAPSKNDLSWSKDGKRLFFGLKPKSATPDSASTIDDTTNQGKGKEINLFDTASLLKKHEVDVWHWDDPRIIPNQKKQWKDVKDQTYRAVYHVTSDRIVQLADLQMPFIIQSDNSDLVLGRSNLPYLKSITWEGTFSDFYIVSLKDGTRKLIVSRLDGGVSLSPTGRYAAYYKDKNWFLYNVREATTRNLTAKLGVPFHNEEYDKPDTPPGYGIEGWVENDRAVLLYDKYDLWQFPIDEGQPLNLTNGEGRKTGYSYRIEKTDSEAQFFTNGQTVLLTAYHNTKKHTAFYKCSIGRAGIERLLEEEKRFTFVAKAKHSDTYLFTRQSYTEFPDLWATDAEFHSPKKLSNVNPQIDEFAWGTAELIEWNSLDGIPLQGVLIKPGNCEPGKLYPVLVYFYELSSQRLYEFNQVVVNHRPCFPFYASNGYALFLPDVRYEIGRPGFSATKCIVPGVQKLIDMGIADPKAIALHGHSWSGYQTAFVITQTDIFAAAIAGAAVANMTSAYSGLRLETGLARQFQYEQDQSRIGGSLWELRDRYIENSPVFFADRIHTPLLLEAGDEDEAVPWQQSIEMYLAMRRLGKPCVLLQYRGEPHHLKKYPNKLDYSIKMKEYLDHYLKGMPAPEWISKGVPYREE